MLQARIAAVCRRQLRRGKLTNEQAKAVKAVIRDQLGMEELTRQVRTMTGRAQLIGEFAIIDWLIENWQKILAIILSIVAALGL